MSQKGTLYCPECGKPIAIGILGWYCPHCDIKKEWYYQGGFKS